MENFVFDEADFFLNIGQKQLLSEVIRASVQANQAAKYLFVTASFTRSLKRLAEELLQIQTTFLETFDSFVTDTKIEHVFEPIEPEDPQGSPADSQIPRPFGWRK